MSRPAGRRRAGHLARCGLLVLTLAAAQAPSATAAPVVPTCAHVAVSPDFLRDRTVFCAGMAVYGLNPSGPGVFVSTDGGRSWAKSAGQGLDGVTRINTLVVSPLYATDRAVYVVTNTGLLRSTDRGATFVVTDPLVQGATWDGLTPFVTRRPGLPPQGSPRVNFAWTNRSRTPAHLDPPLHAPATVSDPVDQFLVPPGFDASTDPALATGTRSVGFPASTLQPFVLRCVAGLSCAEPLHEFSVGSSLVHAWLAPDYERSRTVYVLTDGFPVRGLRAWRSTNGGASFSPWGSLDRLLAPVDKYYGGGSRVVTLGVSPVAPKRYYLRVSYVPKVPKSPAPPANQVFRSEDAGQTWTLVAWSRPSAPKHLRGSLPWTRYALFSPNDVVVAPDGRLFTIAERGARDMVFCSVDRGRTWAQTCPR